MSGLNDLTELRRVAEAATPGPWMVVGLNEEDDTVVTVDDDPICHAYPDDSRYIAAADPQTVLALIERLERAEEAMHRVRKAIAILSGPTRDEGHTDADHLRLYRDVAAEIRRVVERGV